MSLYKTKLAGEIKEFLYKYAAVSPNYDEQFDEPEERFTGPDPSMMLAAAKILDKGGKPDFYVHSEWGSGCYKPYSDIAGREWHDALLSKLEALTN